LTRYRQLLSLSVEHQFFGQGVESPLSFLISPDSNAALNDCGCLCKSHDSSAQILMSNPSGDDHSKLQSVNLLEAFVEKHPSASIEIHLISNDPHHYLYSQSIVEYLHEVNAARVFTGAAEDESMPVSFFLSPKAAMLTAALRSVDTDLQFTTETGSDDEFTAPVFVYRGVDADEVVDKELWGSHADALRRPICILKIPVLELLRHARESDSMDPISINIKLGNRKVMWRYNLVSALVNENANMQIIDRSDEYKFKKISDIETGTTTAARFISTEEIPLSAHPSVHFELRVHQKSGEQSKASHLLLPAANCQNLSLLSDLGDSESNPKNSQSQATYVADIYVNL